MKLRIAPSPTGKLHIGNARTALFNWLYAKANNGTFLVRIDDTDTERSTEEFKNDIIQNFRWLGIDWDEGVDIGGPHGEYKQSLRFDRYQEVANQLLSEGLAYEDDGAVRFKVPDDGSIEFKDYVRGDMSFNLSDVEDFVILRSDKSPTYHLASTVDDIDYGITIIARGEDILSSTPKHILIMQALNSDLPDFCHLPLLFGPDGKKLSKRHGDTSVEAFRDKGILQEAMFNYLCLLGWSPGNDLEKFDSEFPRLAGTRTHTFKKGRKFVKIIEADAEGNSRSVWGFINLTHDKFEVGDVLLAAGWAAPALNKARGNLFNLDIKTYNDPNSTRIYGPDYLR